MPMLVDAFFLTVAAGGTLQPQSRQGVAEGIPFCWFCLGDGTLSGHTVPRLRQAVRAPQKQRKPLFEPSGAAFR